MRRFDPFDMRATLYSIVLHGAVSGVAWFSTFHRPDPVQFLSFEIELVSPPPAVQAAERAPAREELVVERPRQPERARPEPEPEAPRIEPQRPPERPTPRPEPRREPEPRATTPPEPSPDPAPATGPEPPPETPPTTGGEGINVRLEGLRRDYPVYYENIIRQIGRCFRWTTGGNWLTKVRFVIRADGNVTGLEFVSRSGNTAFDFEAMGAVDCAGQGRFGPLPEDLPYESLPVEFEFRPIGR